MAHPGHELRVHHWMEQHRPLYCCLTDGSGGNGASRMPSTSRLLESLGARRGPIYGRYSDKAVYRWLLDADTDIFVQLTSELAAALTTSEIDHVVGDAMEGFNPVHDMLRAIVDGAVEMVRARTGRAIRSDEFVLESNPTECPEPVRADARWVRLDDAALTRKIDAAISYPELRDEVTTALERFGRQAFATECLRPSTSRLMRERFEREAPWYEQFGEQRVAQGRYDFVLRYHAHVRPALEAIDSAVAAASAQHADGHAPISV